MHGNTDELSKDFKLKNHVLSGDVGVTVSVELLPSLLSNPTTPPARSLAVLVVVYHLQPPLFAP